MLQTLCITSVNYLKLPLKNIKPYPIISAFQKPLCPPELSMTSVEESDVGILCYISNLPGFRGILKQRYSDFIVNEVDLDGNVVHLTSLESPLEVPEEKKEKIADLLDKDYTPEIEYFRALAGDSDVEKLKKFIDQIGSGADNNEESIILSPSSDKSHRTAVHNFFKERLKFLVTDTVDGPDSLSRCIRVRLSSGGNNSKGRNSRKRKDRGDKPYDSRGSNNWPEHIGKFLRFHLYKENKDTQEALGLLGKMLGIKPTSFGFAGTKDKRSVSTQRRFGSSSIPTHLIGAALLRGEWKAAVSMILDPREGEREATRKIREYYKESGDIEGTIRQLPRHLVAERAILHCFQKCPGNYLQALLAIPRTLRMMFVHSYQSYLWNHSASMRVQKYGFQQVVLGDLVYCKEQETDEVRMASILDSEDGSSYDTQVDCHLEDTSIIDLSEVRNTSVKVISEEDIAAEKYTIDDIVLPLPGSRISYPLNDAGRIYHDLAEKDGISLTDAAHNSKEFSLTSMTGAYRKVFQKPKDFEWELLNYTDANVPLAETDWDIIAESRAATSVRDSDENDQIKLLNGCSSEADNCGNEIELPAGSGDAKNKNDDIQKEEPLDASKTEESQMALKLRFTLPASCYATMAVRELLKTSTSVAFHKALNEQA